MFSEFLKKVDIFAELSNEDVDKICGEAWQVILSDNEVLFYEGDEGDKAYIIQDGQLEILKQAGGREILLAVRGRGTMIGELALLQGGSRTATVRARGDANLVAIRKETLDSLLATSPSAARAMLRIALARLQGTQAQLQQSEQMAQLGTLTAGVAHELNNPAAAVKRGADQMQEVLEPLAEAQAAFDQHSFEPAQRQLVDALAARARNSKPEDNLLSPLKRSSQEQELEDWLDDAGARDPWDLASALVDLGIGIDYLDELRESFDESQLDDLLHWVVATHQAYSLLEEIKHGAGRISEIVKALKSYAYLDQAPIQSVDIHEGLNNTLVILRHKLKEGIEVVREYAPDLPHIQGYGSELNQVWTNIIDNAIDAVGGHGRITLRTRREDDWVVVEIVDDGPGIPEEIRPRIFDAFFTTKPPGKGTGLGLGITYNIVVHKHSGDIRVTSVPGETCFAIWLPLNFEDAGTSPVDLSSSSSPL